MKRKLANSGPLNPLNNDTNITAPTKKPSVSKTRPHQNLLQTIKVQTQLHKIVQAAMLRVMDYITL